MAGELRHTTDTTVDHCNIPASTWQRKRWGKASFSRTIIIVGHSTSLPIGRSAAAKRRHSCQVVGNCRKIDAVRQSSSALKYSFKTHFGVKLIFAYLCRSFFSPRVLLDESCHLSRQLRQLAHVWGPTSPAFNAGSLIGRSPTCCIKTLATLDGYRY